METDSVDRIVQAWRERDPQLDSSSLEVTGRLLLCAGYYERMVGTVLKRFGLSIADFDVLNTLRRVGDQQGSKPSDLARSSLITTGAMTSRLDRLERAELIRRTPDPADRRGVLVRLTSRGSEVAGQALRELIGANEAFLEPLSGQQRDSIASALRQLLVHHEPG
ncbi:MarR family winged helix-turn-helix transcriptional regulator [Micromonospora eburnea]|uniref:Transcriptional regulator, MarR family n=1 Tax=Micromonospora eburnea TaxID=227316 RepID=A0A1C6UY13_9ACTN|nr:MarR family transcriptional regulator [Micromonospora eburnea]SCL58899.1 transcriptional regulator, MarR family [Micromonospora eburnea]